MRVLIIKTGHSETFNERVHSPVVSLGDTLRTTFLLSFFQEVVWLTSEDAKPMLERLYPKNKFVTNFNEVNIQDFNLIINLEKNPEFYDIVNSTDIAVGFFEKNDDIFFKGYDQKITAIEDHLIISEEEYLLECLNIKNKEFSFPIIILDNDTTNKYDYGLNWQVGKKWPKKSIEKEFWNKLATEIEKTGATVSWQRGFDDINEYIEWIDSCRCIITLDSLGLHLANQLGKKIIALFGPTNDKAIFLNNGIKIKYTNESNINSRLSMMDVLDEVKRAIKALA